jgi:hypothetical protein
MRRTTVILGSALVLGAVALGGCTSGGGRNSSAGTNQSVQRGAAAAYGSAARPAAGGAAGANAASSAQGVTASTPLVDGSAKIRAAEMTVGVRRGHVPATADRAGAIALSVGGEIDADDRSSGHAAAASLQLRVPPEALTSVLTRLSRLGREESRQLSTTDVTQKVADVDSRVASAREAIARLRTLYTHATKVGDVIAVESELSRRESDLEALEAQQRTLARQISMATIALTVETLAPPVTAPKTHHRGGFVGGLHRGWDGFVASAGWVATAAATVLPFAVVALLIAGGVWALHRRRRGPTPTPTQ